MENKEVRIQGIRYVAPTFDQSGYAKGARNWLVGLVKAGVPIFINPVSLHNNFFETSNKS
jgi:hypothetical protein